MKQLRLARDELRTLTDAESFVEMLEAALEAKAIAFALGGRWYLLHSEDLRSFQVELRLGVKPGDFLASRPEAPLVDVDTKPVGPALVFAGGEIVAAWVPDPDWVRHSAIGGGGLAQGSDILYSDSPSPPAPSHLERAEDDEDEAPEGAAAAEAAPAEEAEPGEAPPGPIPPAVPAAPPPPSDAQQQARARRRAEARSRRLEKRERPGIFRALRRRSSVPSAAPPPPSPPPPPPDAPPEQGDRTLRRTPHMDAPEKLGKAPGTTFEVSVYTDTEELRGGESGEGIAVQLPAGVEEIEVGVLLQLSEHFETTGEDEYARLTISLEQERSEKASFELRVVEEPPGGKAAISALFTLRGRSCGQIARAWDWDGDGAEAPPAEPAVSAAVSMPMHADAEQADLSIYVTSPVNDGVNYLCAVETPHLDGYTKATTSEAFAIPEDGYKFMTTFLNALTDERKTPEQRLRSLREVGHEAWEAAPAIVKEVLWALVDGHKPLESINIVSVEPVLPWELMIPRRLDGKEPRKLPPLGIEYAIGRWTRDDGQAPPPRLPIDSAFAIAPVYGDERRELNKEEVEFVIDRLRGERAQPATIDALDERFEKEHASLLHFVCHGSSGVENDDEIELEGDDRLRAREMETLDGFEALCQAKHPFVFLNSCSTGRAVPALSGGSGFPRSFGNLGAHAIVAPLWPVDDTLAHEIAVEVYETALAPGAQPVASILRDIRKRGYEAEDVDTFAAYCFFGDPLARLELVDP